MEVEPSGNMQLLPSSSYSASRLSSISLQLKHLSSRWAKRRTPLLFRCRAKCWPECSGVSFWHLQSRTAMAALGSPTLMATRGPKACILCFSWWQALRYWSLSYHVAGALSGGGAAVSGAVGGHATLLQSCLADPRRGVMRSPLCNCERRRRDPQQSTCAATTLPSTAQSPARVAPRQSRQKRSFRHRKCDSGLQLFQSHRLSCKYRTHVFPLQALLGGFISAGV
mmetsp:Transcript_70239/g.195496  ORF Transcript_70239/g.195496 Transcript_70239/m.195496 type:complete len:225 (-) Transcript_70239:41-715(-)